MILLNIQKTKRSERHAGKLCFHRGEYKSYSLTAVELILSAHVKVCIAMFLFLVIEYIIIKTQTNVVYVVDQNGRVKI